MSEILKMKSVPILNVTDFYKWFDILDILRNRDACVRFALGHFKWSNSINLHHIDVLQKCCQSNTQFILTKSSDYWNSDRKGFCKNPCNTLAGYEDQKIVVDKIYSRFEKEFPGQECRILIFLIAGVLLGNRTETCLQNISAAELKSAYKRESGDCARTFETEKKTNVINLSLKDSSSSIRLPFFTGSFRLPINPKLQPSSSNRFQTWVVQATAKASLELFDTCTAKVIDKLELESNERLFCLVLNETVVKILPNVVRNGKNTLMRKKDGIYLNDRKYAGIPLEASSFAVGTDLESPWMIYVCDGYVRYINSDGIGFRRKVSEQINVIAEVCVVNEKAVIVRNDGMVWGGDSFISGGVSK